MKIPTITSEKIEKVNNNSKDKKEELLYWKGPLETLCNVCLKNTVYYKTRKPFTADEGYINIYRCFTCNPL